MSKQNAYSLLSEHLDRQAVLKEFFFVYFGSQIKLPSGRIIHRPYKLEPSDNPASIVRRWIVGEASLKANTREVIARNYLALQDLDMVHKKRDLEESERKQLYHKAVTGAGTQYIDKAKSACGGEARILNKIARIKESILHLTDPTIGYGSHFNLNKLSYKAKYYDTDYVRSI